MYCLVGFAFILKSNGWLSLENEWVKVVKWRNIFRVKMMILGSEIFLRRRSHIHSEAPRCTLEALRDVLDDMTRKLFFCPQTS